MANVQADPAKKMAMVIDLARCVGCNSCVLSCKIEHNAPTDKFNTWIESWDCGEYPQVKRANLPKLCNHCDNPSCVTVCPTGASHKTYDGIVLVDEQRCIGCKYCMAACPFSVRWANDEGTVSKCTFCVDRARNGLLPACVSNCPSHARMFGDLNDPNSEVSRALENANGEVLMPELGMGGNVYYIGLSRMQSQPVTSGIWHGGKTVVARPE